MAQEGVRAFAQSLPRIVANPTDPDARSEALSGAWLCGACLGAVTMALHHKLCHVLGGSFDLPHAETHAVVLPHAAAYNAPATPEAMARLSRALQVEDAPRGLYDLAGRIGAPRALRDLGMPAERNRPRRRSRAGQPLRQSAPHRARGPAPPHRGGVGGRAARDMKRSP